MNRAWISDLRNSHVSHKLRQSSDASTSPAVFHPMIALQHSVGNARVARMLAQREDVEEEEEELIQTQRTETSSVAEVGLEGGPVSEELAGRISSQRGGGSPLAEGQRQSMEAAFGASFADVRVHTGAEAETLNRSVSSHAFTTGSDIFFGRGSSPSDQSLLAHELTHVVQQRGAAGGGPMTVTPAGDADEQEAEATSATVTSELGRSTS